MFIRKLQTKNLQLRDRMTGDINPSRSSFRSRKTYCLAHNSPDLAAPRQKVDSDDSRGEKQKIKSLEEELELINRWNARYPAEEDVIGHEARKIRTKEILRKLAELREEGRRGTLQCQ